MENQEEVFNLLEEFEKAQGHDIPRELEEYLNFVAKTGDPIFVWSKVKYLFQQKLQQVLCDFFDSCPNNDVLQCPNVDQFNFDLMKNKILERLETFSSAPFTIQRLSELLTCPRKEYNRTDKFMRAVEKNILVVTTREPGNPFAQNVLNGVDGVERLREDEAMQVDGNPVPAASSSSGGNALAAVSCGNTSGKPLNGIDDEEEEEEEEEEEISEEDDEEDSLESVQRSAQQEARCDDIHTTADTLPDSPERQTEKSTDTDSATVNGHFKSHSQVKLEITESASPPESSNFNSSDKLIESSESSSSSLPGDSSETFNAASASQDFSSSSEENYQDSNSEICETVASANDNTENKCSTAIEDISLPPEPCNKDLKTENIAAENAEANTSTIEPPHGKEPEPSKPHEALAPSLSSEPPSKRICLGCYVDAPSAKELLEDHDQKCGNLKTKSIGTTASEEPLTAQSDCSLSCRKTEVGREALNSLPEPSQIVPPENVVLPGAATSKDLKEEWSEDVDQSSKCSTSSIVKSSDDTEKISTDSLPNGSENDVTA